VEHRQRIGILVPGGIGKEDNIPCLVDLISRAAGTYDVNIYSFSRLTLHPSLALNLCSVSFPPAVFGWNPFLKAAYFLWRIRKDHAQKNFTIMHGFWVIGQGIVAVLAGKLLRIPSVISLPGGDTIYLPAIGYGGMRNGVYRKVIRWCIGEADRTVVLTNFQQRTMEANGVRPKRLSVIPFGADISKFTFRSKAISEPLRLGFIGNLNTVKDPFTLIKAFSILVRKFNCTLTIVGQDVLMGRVEEYARMLGVNDKIRWRGKILHDAVPAILQETDFLIVTSLFEGEGVVVMEAFAAGVVVVGTGVGLLADMGDDRVVVLPGDAEGLAAKIETLIKEPQVIRELQLSNRTLAEKHSAEWTWSEYKKLYGKISHRGY
jgi:glycosyltransferase involved in cell wall biosynthesis